MAESVLRSDRPVALARIIVRLGLVVALVCPLAADLPQFSADRECRDGEFGSGFGSGFDIKRCDIVIRRNGGDVVLRARLPQ